MNWEICEHSWSATSVVDTDTGEQICELSIYDEATEENQDELEVLMKERATLIASAPQMTEALELWCRINKVADKFGLQHLHEVSEWEEFSKLMNKLCTENAIWV